MTAHHAVLASLPHQARAIVRVTGDDASRFLQGLLTADVGDLTPGTATPAALLTVKGKIVSEVWVLAVAADEPWLVLPAALADDIVAKLDGHIIMDDVELEPLPDYGCAIVWREGAAPLTAAELQPRAELRAFDAGHPLPGALLVGPRAAIDALAGEDVGSAADAQTFTAARIREGRPAWGHELVEDRFPPEVGFVAAVSYDKGCYLGQEPLSRIHNRGQVNRVMVRVALGRALDPALDGARDGGPVELRRGDAEVGSLTSWAGTSGLAIVKRAQAAPGTTLTAASSGGEPIAVEVVSGPLGDDPGRSGRAAAATVTLGGRR